MIKVSKRTQTETVIPCGPAKQDINGGQKRRKYFERTIQRRADIPTVKK